MHNVIDLTKTLKMFTKSITIISNKHSTSDDLLFHRYAKSISKIGAYEIRLIAVNKEDKVIDNVHIKAIKPSKNRIMRFSLTNIIILFWSLKYPSSAYLLMTPDLLIIGLLLKFIFRKKVIYCALENYAEKLPKKRWIPKYIRLYLIPILIDLEEYSGNILDAVVVVDSNTKNRFLKAKRLVLLPNYPSIEKWVNTMDGKMEEEFIEDGKLKMVYVGNISVERGIKIISESLRSLDNEYEVHLYGPVQNKESMNLINGDKRIIYHGTIPWPQVIPTIKMYDIGLCIYEKNIGFEYIGENTTKLFEYWAAGIPVICSDFPGLKKIVEDTNGGVAINTDNQNALVFAIESLKKQIKLRKILGQNGYRAVKERFNWEAYRNKLSNLLEEVLSY